MFRKLVAVILAPTISSTDATGIDVLEMRDALKSAGYVVRIFADAADPECGARHTRRAFSFLRRHRGLVIYHHGIRWLAGEKLLRLVRGPLMIRDHNVTPARFFDGLPGTFVENTRVGIEQRRSLARRTGVARYLPCSQFSATELISFGVDPARIAPLPPLHHIEELTDTDADPTALKRWSQQPADVLFVGRIAPNKGHRQLIQIAAVYQELFGQSLQIRLVGPIPDELNAWQRLLMQEAKQHNLHSHLDMTGRVSNAELKAAYRTSRLFISCSEHEGFCVPLVEASAMGLPVLIGDQPAMVETMGDVAVSFSKEQNDAMATMIHRLLHSAVDRENLARKQRASMSRRFNRKVLIDRFLEIVREVQT